MSTTVRQLRRYVQKIAKIAGLDQAETGVVADCIVGISKAGSCKVSDIVRALNRTELFRDQCRRLYEALADNDSGLDQLRDAWLDSVAPVANKMPFIAVDPSDIIKPYGKAFDFLDVVRDASDRDKRIGTGFPTVQIEATNHAHQNLPLGQQTFSTKHPEYRGWYDFIGNSIMKVLTNVGRNATWLFDRGFDADDFYTILDALDIGWVVRQLQTRNVILENGDTVRMQDLAASMNKFYAVNAPYVNKRNHELSSCPVYFNYAPIRLPHRSGRYWMIVVTGLRAGDMVLLTNQAIGSAKQARPIVLAYLRRWGIEEGIRCWKQKSGVEDFRVRNWNAIGRMTFFSMLAYGIQALWLLTRPKQSARLISKVKVFIEKVLFLNYRMWDGVQIALRTGD
jgi:hypothetical protein